MLEDKNNPSTGSLFKSKYKTNDGSEEDESREDYYGTYKGLDGKVLKITGYIRTSGYGKWLKLYFKDPDQQQQVSTPQQQAPSFIPNEHIKKEQDPEEDIPF